MHSLTCMHVLESSPLVLLLVGVNCLIGIASILFCALAATSGIAAGGGCLLWSAVVWSIDGAVQNEKRFQIDFSRPRSDDPPDHRRPQEAPPPLEDLLWGIHLLRCVLPPGFLAPIASSGGLGRELEEASWNHGRSRRARRRASALRLLLLVACSALPAPTPLL